MIFRTTNSCGGFLLILLLCVPALAVSAQQQERRGFIGLGIGPSVPFGSFRDASRNNPRAGSALPGYTDTMLNIGYRRGARFGIASFFAYGEYVMRESGNDDWWQVAEITVGPMYTYPISRRSALDLKATAGFLALTPVIDSFTTQDATGGGFGLDMRATLRYDVFRRWAVFAEGGVQSANVYYPATGNHTDVRVLVSGLGFAYRPRW